MLKHPDFLSILMALLQHEKRAARKEAVWIMSNLLAGTVNQIELVMNYPGMIQQLFQMCDCKDLEVNSYY